jgi:hypothetical protein
MNDVYKNIQYPTKIPVKDSLGNVIGYVTGQKSDQNRELLTIKLDEPISIPEGQKFGVSMCSLPTEDAVLAKEITIETIKGS